ncbi:MAG: metallophosphoesterase family protein [Planctomycetota bacterium]|jgi:predicted phosphodiesterase
MVAGKTIRVVLGFLALAALACLLCAPTICAEEKCVETSRTGAKELPVPEGTDSFTFAIVADRTSSGPISLRVLEQAVEELNVLRPDFVITVGDLIPGYTNHEKWIHQMKQFRVIMDRLEVPWYPVAGNHDIYWGGKNKPKAQHEPDFEKHFGPVWYSFPHKKCRFVAFYTDEGDPETGKRAYDDPAAQKMSPEQAAFLEQTMEAAKDADHVLLFMHIPRWGFGGAADWKRTPKILRKAGNVSAVFAGHTHVMQYYGTRDGIEYHTVGTTGGSLEAWCPEQGFLHHYDLVTVRGRTFHVAAVKVGSVIDPRAGRDPLRTAPRRKLPILKKRKWNVNKEEKRILTCPIEVPDFPGEEGLLRIAVEGSLDDTGDRGLCYALLDAHGMTVKSGFLCLKAACIVDFPVAPKTKWTLLLIDGDTKLGGKKPGNNGKLQIQVNHGASSRWPARKAKAKLGWSRPEEFRAFLEGRRFRFTRGGKVANKRLELHPNGIVGHRDLATTYWEVDGKGRLVFLDDERKISAVFDKVKAMREGGVQLEGNPTVKSSGTWVLEELE